MSTLHGEFPGVSVETLFGLFGKKRQWYYAQTRRAVPERARRKLLSEAMGYHRSLCHRLGGVKMYAILREEFGAEVTGGRDSFLRLYRECGYALEKPKRRRTTDSRLTDIKFPDITKGVVPQSANHIWMADITYIWIYGDVLYLHLVTDAYSHAVIGWYLSETLEASNTLVALEMAIRAGGGGNLCGTVHHSDRGSQYASKAYVDKLMEHHIRISMTERYNPTDNALAERVNGILKVEWIYCGEIYRDKEEAWRMTARNIWLYNEVRPHMSIGNVPPMSVYRGEREPGKNLWKKKGKGNGRLTNV